MGLMAVNDTARANRRRAISVLGDLRKTPGAAAVAGSALVLLLSLIVAALIAPRPVATPLERELRAISDGDKRYVRLEVEAQGSVRAVKFFVNGELHTTDTTYPFSLGRNTSSERLAPFDADPGTYRIDAEIHDATGTSRARPITVTIPDPEAYPSPETTGVPEGTQLQRSDSVTVTTDGRVIEGVEVYGQIVVRANNVTIRNSRIHSGDATAIALANTVEKSGLVVEDVEMVGATGLPAVLDHNYTLRRVLIRGYGDGPRISGDNVVIEQSYIEIPTASGHNDGIQMTDGANVRIIGNRIWNKNNQTSAIFVVPTFGPVHDVTIEDNLLEGGGYTVYAFGDGIAVRNNRIVPGYYGAKSVDRNVKWLGNLHYVTEEPIR